MAQNWHFWSIWARPCRLTQCPVGGLVGGCGARAVSRKTPIYFIIVIIIIKVADQDQTLLKYVLLAIHHGRQGRVSEEDLAQSELVTEDVRGFLEERLGRKFWTNLDIYEVELIKIAKIFGCQDSVTKIMQMPWSADFYSELLKMVCCSKKYFFC